MPYFFLTQENLAKLRKQFIEHKTILLNMLIALIVLGSVIIFVLFEQIFVAWSVLLIALILVIGLDRSIQRIFSFEQYFQKTFKFSYESVAIQANLPLSHRTPECQVDGPIEKKLVKLFEPHTFKEFFWKILHFGTLLIAVAVLIVLFQASYIDHQRSQNKDFTINFQYDLGTILEDLPSETPSSETQPQQSDKDEKNQDRQSDEDEKNQKEQSSETPSSETQLRQLDPSKTPSWIVNAIKIVNSIEQLVTSKPKLESYLETATNNDSQSATAKTQAKEIAGKMITLLSKIQQNPVLPEDLQSDVEKLQQRLQSIRSAIDSSSSKRIEKQKDRLEKSSTFSSLDSLKERIKGILNDLGGEKSGFSQKLKELYEKSMTQANEGKTVQSEMPNTLQQLKNRLQEELEKISLYKAPGTLQQLEERLEKELGQISVFIKNFKSSSKSSPGGESSNSSSSKKPIGNGLKSDSVDKQRGRDPGAVETEQTLQGQERPISYAPPI